MAEHTTVTRRRATGRPSASVVPAGLSGRGTESGSGHPWIAWWERRYRMAVILGDVLVSACMFGLLLLLLAVTDPAWVPPFPELTVLVSLTILVVCLIVGHAWRPRELGQGAEEYRRLGRGLGFGAVSGCVLLVAAGLPEWRVWGLAAVPATALAVFPERYLLRRFLHHARRRDRCMFPVLAAGSAEGVRALITQTRRATHVGWRVEAACLDAPPDVLSAEIAGVPVIGSLEVLATQVRRGGYRIVAVTPSPQWTPERLQRLAWDLEEPGTEMVISPGLMEIAGPRVHVSGMLGIPVLRVSAPRFSGVPRVVKWVVDKCAAGVGLVLLAPLLLGVALAIKCTDGGPVFYRQVRAGKGGTTFRMWKFRTMVVGAERMRAELAGDNDADGPLFKLRADPRITRVGRLLRKHSLDELPQLVNVLAGHMSLIGPRPPLPEETCDYNDAARRKLLVRPGLTGLWQVSGRSDLGWDESVRLDLRYVEDWSLVLDMVILWKTVRAVLSGKGAY
ncbi:sugar transferase [Sciscionella sediminilitoris]|uniref:sugar transferase n=1 Tax=Sciscionella sediminilitoris TaxID=1445613 RepID=UPI00068A4AE6|nr:sugar transferase [Sciscionella sp. SE31]